MKKLFLIIALISCVYNAFSQEKTAKEVVSLAIKEEVPYDVINFIDKELKNITVPAEKRALLTFKGQIQESISMYDEAKKSYAQAAGIRASDVEGMKKRTSEELVLDAVRCALSAGQGETALLYLNSAVRNSKDEKIQSYIKLYEQWAALAKAETIEETKEIIGILKVYLTFSSMDYVKKSILLTLWYLTNESSYAETLVKEFPSSLEAGIVTKKVILMPAPFWYFMPKKESENFAFVKDNTSSVIQEENTKVETKNNVVQNVVQEEKYEIPKKQQVGLFKDKANAENFSKKINEKGFSSYVQEQVRSSGEKYYIVVVNENKDGTMGTQLKTSGFECYPLY